MYLPGHTDHECAQEIAKIEREWVLSDRSMVHSYEQFLALLRIKERKLAAYLRCAQFSPFIFQQWLEHHARWDRLPPNPTGWGPSIGFGPPTRATQIANSWGGNSGTLSGTWGDEGWGTSIPAGHRDPAWDGTRVPKTPQKSKRRRRRQREAQEQIGAARERTVAEL
ncbi:hypothetical protein B0H15DRAFT_805700 [Mycena belliarum]|uniref:Uncharacterized protein n=1 Tax=Mycena belliarum TaxID=1033014 RepID=A0AAD6TTN5_9AGAR|nr:hypothetical protein B0H15DRAFT_805700 [Mycena belliae]